MDEKLKVELCAMAVHQANCAYDGGRLVAGQSADDAWEKPPWDQLDEAHRERVRAGVRRALADPGLTAEQSHEGWVEAMRVDGWRYGPERDEEAQTHPCMVPYDQLPRRQQIKDELFLETVRAAARTWEAEAPQEIRCDFCDRPAQQAIAAAVYGDRCICAGCLTTAAYQMAHDMGIKHGDALARIAEANTVKLQRTANELVGTYFETQVDQGKAQ